MNPLPPSYRTLATEGTAVIREKASKFLGIAFPIADEAMFKQRLASIEKEHHDARHHCYAYVLGNDGELHRSNDAGEPSGTAGKPILRHLQGRSLTFCAVVVVRWFGGTLLGKGGLVQAYGEAAKAAIASAGEEERIILVSRKITCSYDQVERVKASVAKALGEVRKATYGDACELEVMIPIAHLPELEHQWQRAGMHINTMS